MFPLSVKAEVAISDVLLFPLKIVTKPFVLALYGWAGVDSVDPDSVSNLEGSNIDARQLRFN